MGKVVPFKTKAEREKDRLNAEIEALPPETPEDNVDAATVAKSIRRMFSQSEIDAIKRELDSEG